MGLITIDKNELLNHAIDDGNILTIINGVLVQKKEWSDEFGAAFDLIHWSPAALFGFTQNGSLIESGNKLAVSCTRAGTNAEKGAASDLTFSDGTFEVDLQNILLTVDVDFAGLSLFKDAQNFLYITRRDDNPTLTRLHYVLKVNNVTIESIAPNNAATSIKFKVEDDGTDIHVFYDVGAGWVEISTASSHGQSIGTGYKVYLYARTQGSNGTISADFMYFRATGTGIFWNQKADTSVIKTIYNTQAASEGAGAILQFGSATIDDGIDVTYDYKIGTDAWVLNKTKVYIISLDDQVTDDGTFSLRVIHGNGTDQSTFTRFLLPTTSGVIPPIPPGPPPFTTGFTLETIADESGSDADSVALRAPEMGDSKQVDTRVIIRKSRGGTQLGYKDSSWPNSKLYSYNFRALSEDKYDELKLFLKQHAGEKIATIDHDDVRRIGWIITSSITFAIEQDFCSYNLGFTFKQDPQVSDLYDINTQASLSLDAQDSEPLFKELA